MKKRIAIALLLVVVSALGFAADELEIYSRLYEAAETPQDQRGILQNVIEMKLPDSGSFYAAALTKLVRQYPAFRQKNNPNDLESADSLALFLADLLGNEKLVSSADDLWRISNTGYSANPLVKAEVYIALGKMQAAAYLPAVIKVLNDLNARPVRGDPAEAERIAYGAILSLEKYAAPEGYLPVFFASVGWYSERVKAQAAQSLPLIVKDPTDQMINLIKATNYDVPQKLTGLRSIEKSDVSNESRASVAAVALTYGWTGNTRTNTALATLRKESMQMIAKYGASDPAVYTQLAKSYTSPGLDREERLLSIGTLKALKTDKAVELLNQFLVDLNIQQLSGAASNRQESEIMVREIIPALGSIASSTSKPPLMTVASSNWSSAVDTLARDALTKIK